MEPARTSDFDRDEISVAVRRERELNEALSYLDRAISRLASQEAPSRWLAAHARPRRPAPPTRSLGSVLHRYVAAAFGTGRRDTAGISASPL
jgi:hypothetical protein